MNDCFVLKGDICYSLDARTLRTAPGGYLVCGDGVSLGVFEALPDDYADAPLRDYGHALIIPGLTDLHLHAPQYTYRALGMDLELLEWLNTYTFHEEAKYRDLAYAERAYSLFADDLRKGPNTRACVFATAHVPATLLLMDKLEAAGLCTMVGKVNMDRNATPDLQEASAEASLADTHAWLDAVRARGYRHTTPILTPRFIPSCTDALMHGLAAVQKETGLPVQSHLSENPSECDMVRALCPEADGYGDAYARYGLFGGDVPTIMAHCVWSDEAELMLMRDRGVMVAHCPQSNTNISSGIAPIRRMLDMGVRVGLGSDIAGGCHTSILRAMADAIQVSKLRWRLADGNAAALSLPEAFYLATVGGGSFFGKVGSFAPGYALDAVVLDDAMLATPYPVGIEDRLSRVVYLGDDRQIAAKYVEGVQVL